MNAPTQAPKVGLIGARRVRQGLGPFVARDFVAAGAEVTCFSVTRETSIAPAREAIERFAGVSPRAYVDVDKMFEDEALDAVAILSPAETHVEHLERALERGVPVLCEKPFVWGEPDPVARTAALVDAFDARGLLLHENCLWPFALPGFAELFPGSLDTPPQQFRMDLQPVSRGIQALGDALSHPLSVLQALMPDPDPQISHVSFSHRRPGSPAECLSACFDYHSGERTCAVEIRLIASEVLPRRAALEIDGAAALRVVEPETYRLSLEARGRSVPLDDPLTLLIANFVQRLREPDESERRTRARDIQRRMELLAGLCRTYVGEYSGESSETVSPATS